MVKLLLIGVIPVVLTASIIFYFLAKDANKNPTSRDSVVSKITAGFSDTEGQSSLLEEIEDKELSKQEFLEILEASMSALNERIDNLASQKGVSVPRAVNLTPTPVPIAATYVGPKVIYIPLGGSGGSINTLNSYGDVTTTETIIDSASYPGAKGVYLEADISIYQGNGAAYARLFNKTDGVALNSEVSTTSENFNLKTSGSFNLASGKKTYLIQLKTNTGYSAQLNTARLRVEFN
jgi:hypothetical protein